uniref:FimV/HubP family polar landmark protein n=1 Tax=Microbulbifer agarilyticus TaxID=260552 RepID=UPI0002557F34|nr:FimV/HubP family polar landmark protein [Microbulbifer agarilyticus]
MRVQKLALAVGLVSALGGNGALALGLGEIKVNSTLNQPLDAEIKLLQTRGLGENEIKVRLASLEDFERAGVERGYSLDGIRFDVDYSSGQPMVRITSRSPIREPFLNFLVETRWPSGRLLREYTLLMDLPAFSTNTASQPVRAAERERQQVQRNTTPVQRSIQPTVERAPEPVTPAPAEQTAPVSAVEEAVEEQVQQPIFEEPAEEFIEPQTSTESGSRVYGPVEANKTLWEIARDSRESRDLSVQQTMLAIQRLNPEAFINNNINLLKKGAVLRLPTADEVRGVTRSEAVSQVATQNDAWRDRVADTDVTGAPLDARATVEETYESDTLEGRVSLAAPGDNESVLSGSGSGSSESDALEGELAVTEEELDKSRLEGAELEERIGELNEQIDTMERLVEVSNDELQAVQAAATETNDALEAEAETFESADIDGEALDIAGEESSAFADSEAEGTEVETTADVAPAAETDADANRNRVVVQTRSEPSLVDTLMENIQWIGIGAGALLAALFGFVSWRRRKEEEEAIRQVEAEMAAERALAEAPSESFEDDTLVAVEEFEANDSVDLDQLGEVETDDPVAEAEIHLSLGQYQEAEAKLLTGLKGAPGNVDARLMLLEVYAHQQDGNQFDDHYRQLLGYSDGPVADRAARLRETIAGIGLFAAPETDFSSESLEAAQLDDLGSDLDSFEASFDDLDEFSGNQSAAGSEAAAEGGERDDIDALDDLSLDLGGTDSEASATDDDFSLELDLGDDFAATESDPAAELDSLELDTAPDAQSSEQEFDLDLGALDLGGDDLDSGSGADLTVDSEEPAGASEDFALDELMNDGELDLDNLDLDNLDLDTSLESSPAASEPVAAEAATVAADSDDTGLDFDLDLTPIEGSDSASNDSAVGGDAAGEGAAGEGAGDDLGMSLEDDLGSLDLDSIDLGDLDLGDADLGGAADEPVAAAAETPAVATQAEDLDLDLAVMEEPVAAEKPAASAQSAEDLADLSFDLEGDLDSELNLLEGSDEVSTKLELAQAYLDMGDKEGAREILGEVVEESAGEHQQRAKEMLERMG